LNTARDWLSHSDVDGITHTFSVNNAHAIDGVNGSLLSYDVTGALTGDGRSGHAFNWDAKGQLVSVLQNGQEVAAFEYDALGRQVRTSKNGTSLVLVYRGHEILAKYDEGALATAPAQQYVFGEGVDDTILKDGEWDSGQGLTYLHRSQDHSCLALTDSTGTVVERYSYSAFGETKTYDGAGNPRAGSTFKNLDGFTGQKPLTVNGLYAFRSRVYDPTLGGRKGVKEEKVSDTFYSFLGKYRLQYLIEQLGK
jgi:YD repeat-containing protein